MDNFALKYKNWHQKISFIKSGIRIAACLACVMTLVILGNDEGSIIALLTLAIGIGLAEFLGILEEWM